MADPTDVTLAAYQRSAEDWRPEPLREVPERTGWRVLRLERVEGRHEPWLHVLCRR